ncbi:hypothetical protein FRB94_009156 [Tulasnella sp. JGI-2019a]|nr:hypothetical protein FRB94_009156 [Tulasnella sp. JGI-2019a]
MKITISILLGFSRPAKDIENIPRYPSFSTFETFVRMRKDLRRALCPFHEAGPICDIAVAAVFAVSEDTGQDHVGYEKGQTNDASSRMMLTLSKAFGEPKSVLTDHVFIACAFAGILNLCLRTQYVEDEPWEVRSYALSQEYFELPRRR